MGDQKVRNQTARVQELADPQLARQEPRDQPVPRELKL